MNRHSEDQLDNKGLVVGVGSGVSETDALPTPFGVGSGVGSFVGMLQKGLTDADSKGLVTTNPETTNPKAAGVGSSPSLFREGDTTNPDAVAAIFTNLIDLRTRVTAGIDYLRAHLTDSVLFAKGRARLLAIAHDYRRAVIRYRALVSCEDIHRARMILKRRMHKGWTVAGKRADDLFDQLEREYVVLTDVLRGTPWYAVRQRVQELERLTA